MGAEPPGGLIGIHPCKSIRPGRRRRDGDSEILDGTPVFAGTRVPVQNLADYLEAGDTVDGFLRSFPTVDRELVIAYLHRSKR